MSSITPKVVLSKLLAVVANNSQLQTKLDVDDLIANVTTYMAEFKNDKDTIENMLSIVKRVNNAPVPFSKKKLLNDLEQMVPEVDDWMRFTDGCIVEEPSDELNKLVASDYSELKQMLTIPRIASILRKASGELNYNPMSVHDISKYVNEVISKLEKEITGAGKADDAIMDTFDETSFADDVPIDIDKVDMSDDPKDQETIYRFGWQAINIGLQGGGRPGDTMIVGSLEHNYKSGLVKSLFRHIVQYNDPPTYPANDIKKPRVIFISFEESGDSICQFIYNNIHYNQTGEAIPVTRYTLKQKEAIKKFVVTELNKRGWHVLIMRVNPTDWSYRSLIDLVLAQQLKGYDVKAIICDYVGMLPTTGCDQSGGKGTDKRDMLRRIRNFTTSRNILFISPWQLASQVKAMLTDTSSRITAREILDHIAGNGMYAESRQITHDIDISMLIKIVKTESHGTYLDVAIDKHRMPMAISADLKRFALPMPPNGMPIVDDVEAEKPIHVRRIPNDFF